MRARIGPTALNLKVAYTGKSMKKNTKPVKTEKATVGGKKKTSERLAEMRAEQHGGR